MRSISRRETPATGVGVLGSYETHSLLSGITPAVKLGIVMVYMTVATAVFDAPTLAAMTALGMLVLVTAGAVPIRALLRAMVPFVLFGIGYLWMNLLFGRSTGAEMIAVGPVSISLGAIAVGGALAIRAVCFGVWSMVFVATTDTTDFAIGLMRHVRLPARIAYAALAAYRFLPLFASERAIIAAAQAVRGVDPRLGPIGRLRRSFGRIVPLLATAVRRAERVAIAIESRGFTGERPDFFYRDVRFRRRDTIAIVVAAIVLVAIIRVSSDLGFLRLWSGGYT
ncbi:MAG: energy-coupling factor transporter transmembrane protein EcfT [Spirochaetaceae bacterium]|nr:MAG: energy-coupling factor transporter transmembrane protein EcfT [Spirochaetaceae bacterium]